ncbi:hypothetical protein LCGC14_0842250 [marine sediment metagenome]|uniref:Uncharacterized protein n=1 Tax=marine sediment metagenome TaxID=412755 RepID=A0A0F9RXE2_9ZZZZ
MKKYQAANSRGKGIAVQVLAENETEARAAIQDKMEGNGLDREYRIWRISGYRLIAKAV